MHFFNDTDVVSHGLGLSDGYCATGVNVKCKLEMGFMTLSEKIWTRTTGLSSLMYSHCLYFGVEGRPPLSWGSLTHLLSRKEATDNAGTARKFRLD